MGARELDLSTLTLDSGGHSSFEQGACLLEAASYLAGEPLDRMINPDAARQAVNV